MGNAWEDLAATQELVVTRKQLLGLGLTPRQARRNVDNRRWQVLWPGVYLGHTGPVPDLSRVWGALLYCGEGAVLGGRTVLWLTQAVPEVGAQIEVCLPHPTILRRAEGIRTRQVKGLDQRRATVPGPARLRLEDAVLDLIDRESRSGPVCDLVLRVLQKRLTTSAVLVAALADRSRHRWRKLIRELLAEFDQGIQSPLERKYLHAVEGAHQLPRAARNRPINDQRGERRYPDVHYEKYNLVVELDGREAHPREEAFRDHRRDNQFVVGGHRVLHYGWRDLVARPCEIAIQVAGVLTAQGWAGSPASCVPGCPIGRTGRG